MRACEPHTPEGQKVVDFAMLILPRWLPKPSPWKRPENPIGQAARNYRRLMKKRLEKVLGNEWQPKSYIWAVNNEELSKGKRQEARRQRVYHLTKSLEKTLGKTKHKKSDARKAMVPPLVFSKFCTLVFLCTFLTFL